MEKECEDCKTPTKNKYLGKVNGKHLCRKCRSEIRKSHRKETMKSQIKLRKISRKHKEDKVSIPRPRGSYIKKEISNAYITKEDRQNLFRILIKRGLEVEEVKERISILLSQQIKVREIMKEKNKPESEIKLKQQKMLEELWRY